MFTSRRRFLTLGAAALATAASRPAAGELAWQAASPHTFRVGVTDWNLRKEADPTSFALAKAIGFDGVQVSLATGRPRTPIGGDVVAAYRAESARHGLPIVSTCLNILHTNYLKSDPLGPKRVAEGIALTRDLGVEVMLLPFFDAGALSTAAEQARVADILRDLAPEAARAGVVLGLENTISAADNVRIMERVGSPAVRVYYDVGNSTAQGFDVVEELRWLGAERICEVHVKDNPHFLGEGRIDLPGVVAVLADIAYARWLVLETSSPTRDVDADMRRNLAFTRDLIAARNGQRPA